MNKEIIHVVSTRVIYVHEYCKKDIAVLDCVRGKYAKMWDARNEDPHAHNIFLENNSIRPEEKSRRLNDREQQLIRDCEIEMDRLLEENKYVHVFLEGGLEIDKPIDSVRFIEPKSLVL